MKTKKQRTEKQSKQPESAKVLPPEIPEHPWKQWIGTLKNDALTKKWLREVERYRAEVDKRDAEDE